MIEAIEPAKSPPISSGIAHDTPTVNSRPNTETQEKTTDAVVWLGNVGSRIEPVAITNPSTAITRRAALRLPVRAAHRSESQPPKRLPTAPATNGRLA